MLNMKYERGFLCLLLFRRICLYGIIYILIFFRLAAWNHRASAVIFITMGDLFGSRNTTEPKLYLKLLGRMMTSSNRNIFCVTGPLWWEPQVIVEMSWFLFIYLFIFFFLGGGGGIFKYTTGNRKNLWIWEKLNKTVQMLTQWGRVSKMACRLVDTNP